MHTPQQQAAIEAVAKGESFAMRAVAGSGKTTTAVAAIGHVTAPGIALAFNKRNADELSTRIKAANPTSRVEGKTLNGLGHRVWSDHLSRRLIVNADKTKALINAKGLKLETEEWVALARMVSIAKARAITPGILNQPAPDMDSWRNGFDEIDGDLDLFDRYAEVALTILQASVKLAWKGEIDFDDQLYMPVVFNARFPSIPFVLVDEAQDLSPLQHEMVQRLRPTQIVVVGDPNQAIYAFRGADSSSFESLISRFSLPERPLTMSFRCPKAVAAIAAEYVSDFSVPPTAPDGQVTNLYEIPLRGTLLCRYNAPLLREAFRCLRQQRAVNYLGRDFLSGIKALHAKHPTPTSLDQWRKKKLEESKTDGARKRAEDQYQSLMTLHDAATSQRTTVEAVIKQLLSQVSTPSAVTLSTIHKAKGLEWKEVTFINYQDEVDGGQERNINYVGVTRAQHTLNIHRKA